MSDFGFIEIGPVTIDPQHQPSLKTQLIRIENGEVKQKYNSSRYSCNQAVYKLIEKQEILRDKIVAGDQIPPSLGKIGVCIEANSDTLDSVPYLTHQDFQKQIAELNDLCDYIVVSLSSGGAYGAKSSGLNQYYTNPKALDKLLKTTSDTRATELGKLAAFEYEKMINDD